VTTSHFATSWQDQRNRVGRWQKRLAAIGRGIPVGTSKEEALDDVFAFFMNCYHLRDWVVGSGFKSEADVDNYIRGNNDLALCRDICTGLKHFRAEPKRALFDSSWSTATVTLAAFPERREPIPGEYWVITTDRGEVDMFDLADRCVAAWDAFLTVVD
jgi:hypothetical protein